MGQRMNHQNDTNRTIDSTGTCRGRGRCAARRRITKWPFALAIALWLGVASPAWCKEPGSEFDPEAKPGYGAFVASLTMPGFNDPSGDLQPYGGGSVFWANSDNPGFWPRYMSLDSKALFSKEVPSEFSDAFGGVRIVYVPAGNYDLTSFFVATRLHELPKLRFTVKPGRVTYLGNFDVVGLLRSNDEGRLFLATYWVALSDRSDRDLPAITIKYPKIRADMIDNAALDPRPWRVRYFSSWLP